MRNTDFIRADSVNVDSDYWLWSFSRFNNDLYSIGYNISKPCYSGLSYQKSRLALFKNTDISCTSFENVSVNNWIDNNPGCSSEASIAFTEDSTLISIVRESYELNESLIGVSRFPFTDWTWKKFPYFIRGPKLALLPNGKLFLCGASMIDYNKTYYLILDSKKDFRIETMNIIPSGGDTGYPGVIIEGSTALVSYYSSHEGNACVYIRRIAY